MPRKSLAPVALVALAGLVLTHAAPIRAQDVSTQDYRGIFERQLETFRSVRAAPDLGATRGLVLAPIEGADVEAVAIEQAEPTGGLVLDAGSRDETAPPRASKTHWVLPEAEQATMRVTFAFDSAAIAESEKPRLRQICKAMEEAGVGLFRIVGHTDASGDAVYNQRLSERRAEEVRRFFLEDCGIAAGRLEAIGVGKQFPANAADPFAGENRRVEFQALTS